MTNTQEKLISVREFRMWLEGVEEMQPDDWTPNHIQWKRIREKINNIDVNDIPVQQHLVYNQPTFTPQPSPQPLTIPRPDPIPIQLSTSGLPVPPPIVTGKQIGRAHV